MSKFFKTASTKASYQARIDQALKDRIDNATEEAKNLGLGVLDLTSTVEKAITGFIDGAEKEISAFKKEQAQEKVKQLKEKIGEKEENPPSEAKKIESTNTIEQAKPNKYEDVKTESKIIPESTSQPTKANDDKTSAADHQDASSNKQESSKRFFGR